MGKIEPIDIRCPYCDSFDYQSFEEIYGNEWISLLCDCSSCKKKFQINYRAVAIDIMGFNREKQEIKRNLRNIFLDLLKRDSGLRIKYDTLINSECGESELKKIINYLIDKYSAIFEDKLVPAGKEKEEYLADVIQVLCASEA